jgi:hypothetical protein
MGTRLRLGHEALAGYGLAAAADIACVLAMGD